MTSVRISDNSPRPKTASFFGVQVPVNQHTLKPAWGIQNFPFHATDTSICLSFRFTFLKPVKKVRFEPEHSSEFSHVAVIIFHFDDDEDMEFYYHTSAFSDGGMLRGCAIVGSTLTLHRPCGL